MPSSYDRAGIVARQTLRKVAETAFQAQIAERPTHVRFGSKADTTTHPIDVRFNPESGHECERSAHPLRATNGLMHCSKKTAIRSPRRLRQGELVVPSIRAPSLSSG